MKIRQPYHLPPAKEKQLESVIRLEWWNMGFRLSIVLVLSLVLGGSQAMKAAWLEDILTLLPPIAFLIAVRFRDRIPTKTYPYGFQRTAVIAFLCAAVALTVLGSYLIIDSSFKLVKMEHTSIGAIQLFGHTIWMGWLMIAGLIYSIIPPFIIGRMQEPAAKKVHEKTVFVDAKMSKADWMTGLSGIVGILGVGLGFWWADALAALVIGLDVTKDGITNLKEAVGDLLDRRPRLTSKIQPSAIAEELEENLLKNSWVREAAVRLREEGRVLSGEAFVVPESDENLTRHIAEAGKAISDHHWRIYEVVITPVPKIGPKPDLCPVRDTNLSEVP